jgi:hypothetical protein
MRIELELAFLRRAEEILTRPKESDAAKVADLFRLVFENRIGPRTFRFRPASEWEGEELARALDLLIEVIVQYVARFADPRGIPVTHYARQKRLAIYLDALFSPLLRETVRRSGRDPLVDDSGRPVTDRFLDEPILFLKQEARQKRFPKTKKGGNASVSALRERFHLKLGAKGLAPGERGYEIASATREETARKKLLALLARREIAPE